MKTIKVILGSDPLFVPLTGIGNYTKKIAQALVINDEISEVKLYAYGKFFNYNLLVEDEKKSAEINNSLFVKIKTFLASTVIAVKIYEKISPLLSFLALSNQSDFIYHSPNFVLPTFKGKKVVTIHDLSTLFFPQFHPKARVDFVNNAISRAIDKADHIITDSHYVKNEVVQHFNIDESKVTAIALGANDSFKPRSETECHETLNKHDLKYKQYFIFISTIEPRKNLLNLLAAFERYRQDKANTLPLIIIGGDGWNNAEILDRIQELSYKGWVRQFGYIPDQELYILYSGAQALLFPSVYEGFGLPILEAMQSGVAVLTCPNSTMSEVAEHCAVYVDKDDVDGMADKIEFLSLRKNVKELESNGIQQALKFSWEKCVKETIDVYKKISDIED